jgi:uncharacterized protein DUF998
MTTSTCPPLAVRITKSLLGYGVIAGPIYVVVVAIQAATRAGFDPTRHEASLLANGDLGWIQITNFVLTGAMTIAAAVGIRRGFASGAAARWGAVLVGGYGGGLIAAGIFRADPALGFPPGAPAGRGQLSWHDALHLVSATVGFACLIAACFVVAARFAHDREPHWAWYSRLTALVFAGSFAAVATGANNPVIVVLFTMAVIVGWAWLSMISVKLYRSVR